MCVCDYLGQVKLASKGVVGTHTFFEGDLVAIQALDHVSPREEVHQVLAVGLGEGLCGSVDHPKLDVDVGLTLCHAKSTTWT